MATTENGIYYPNDGKKAADVLADLKAMAESIDKNIQENKFDDKDVKKDISDIKKEQQTQNSDIENLQTNDTKQDELISKLKNVALNAETEESKSIHVEDASTIGQLEVLGNHEQETREGYNLLQNKLTDTTINGVTFKINEDKSVTVNGTATASIIANLITGEYNDNNATEPLIIPDNITNCRLSGCPSGGSSSTYKLDISNQKYELLATDWGEGTNVTINSQEDKKIARVRIIIYSGATVNNLTFKPMLVAGTKEKPYEQYGVMPSPDYPSPVVCLGSNKNELNLEDLEISNNNGIDTYSIDSPNQITLKNKNTTSGTPYSYSFQAFKLNLKNGNYILQSKVDTNSTNYRIIIRGKKNGSNMTATQVLNQNTTSGSFNIDYSQCDEYTIELYANMNYIEQLVTTKYYDIKIEEGAEATSYSPYGQGSTEISKINENFLDLNNCKLENATYTFENDILTVNSINTNGFNKIYIDLLKLFKRNPGKTIIFQFKKLDISKYTSTANVIVQVQYTKNGASDYPALVTKDGSRYEFNIPEDVNGLTYAVLNIFANNTNKYIESSISITEPMLLLRKLSESKVDYVEHQQTDYILNIQQEMLEGDYFVKEADGWKEVHSYSKKIFNGTEAWNLESLSQGNNFYTNIPDALGDTTAPVYSNCFMYYNGLLDKNYSCRISGSKNLNLRCNEKNTVEEFKQMLADKYNAGNPVYAFYKSAIPSKLACTSEQSAVLEELSNLDLFEGVNNIITAEDIALLKLKYALDVKTYVDNQLANVNAQILNIAGGN